MPRWWLVVDSFEHFRYAIAGPDGADDRPAPRPLVPLTVHVYGLLVVKPVTVNGATMPVFAQVTPPLLDTHVAVSPVIALPLFAPGVNDTLI